MTRGLRSLDGWCARRLQRDPWCMGVWQWFTTLYWSTPELMRDYRVLVSCGHVQREQEAIGRDTPSHWWARAAEAYSCQDDAVGRLAATACLSMCLVLREGEPS